jgi:hypothetical protein
VGLGVDDPLFAGGDPLLLVVRADKKLHAFGGDEKLPATIRMAKFEPYQGLDAHIRNVRIKGDLGQGVSVKIGCAARLSDAQSNAQTSDLRRNGDMPVLARGRYLQPEITTTAQTPWSYMIGFEVEGTQGGRL